MLKTERLEERARFTVGIPAHRPLSWLSDLLGRFKLALGLTAQVTCPRCSVQMERVEDKVTYWDSAVMCGTLVYRCSVCAETKELPRVFSVSD
jgi:uncharacterized protein with PIN domain